jgi:hypothetical protein
MKQDKEETGVAAPVDRIVRGEDVAETGTYVLDECQRSNGTGGPLVGEYYGPYWGIHLNEVNGGNEIVIIPDPGDGSSYDMAVKILDFLNESREVNCQQVIHGGGNIFENIVKLFEQHSDLLIKRISAVRESIQTAKSK